MNPDELAKYGTEIGKLSVARGFTDCVRRMLGPAADELGNWAGLRRKHGGERRS
jgi:hypothetical protein